MNIYYTLRLALSELAKKYPSIHQWLKETFMIFWALVKVMVPMLLLVRFIELMGWIEILAERVAPIMGWVGLPGEMGLVWVTTMVSSMYTGMAVFYQLGGIEQLTIAQVSVLGTLMLIAHGLFVEIAITKAAGIGIGFMLLLRIGCAFLLGFILHYIYSYMDVLQAPVTLSWQPEASDNSWQSWFLLQGQTFLAAFIIIAALTLFIRILRFLGIEKLIHALLAPLLRSIGIGVKATNIIIVGLTLGISFGGGLLIQEARSGKIDGKDIFMAMAFLGLCHSMIEDTLLIMLMGADLSAILWGRLIFSFVAIALLAQLIKYLPDRKQRWLYKPVA